MNYRTWLAWTEEEDKRLIALCQNGNTPIPILCEQFPNRTKDSIKGRMRILSIQSTRRCDWSPMEDHILKEKYLSCVKIDDLIPFLPGRTYNTIKSRANTLGMKRKILPIHDITYFDVPNEINCAWAGYIAADGHISDNGRFSFNISTKDKVHLQGFASAVKFTGNIYDYSRSYKLNVKKYGKSSEYSGILHSSVVQIQCPEICKKLNEHWNITPLKTHTLCPPNLTDNRLIMAYLSGLIDGDGWIIKEKAPKSACGYGYSISVMGTKQLMEWVKIIFDTLVPNSSKANLCPTESNNIYDYKVSSGKAYWLAKIFLSLDIPRLERKWCHLREYVSFIENDRKISNRLIRSIMDKRPTDAVLTEFGLLESTNAFLASLKAEKLPTPA